MADLLRPVPLGDLKHLEGGKDWHFEQAIDGLQALTPVRGHLHVQHQGSLLEVKGQAETEVSLTCDRCLRLFHHRLTMDSEEVLGLQEPAPNEAEAEQQDRRHWAEPSLDGGHLDANGGDGSVAETLDPRGSFDPERWVYEQLSLQWPLVTRCGSDCPGPERWSSQSDSTDPRWAALGQLKL